MESLDNEDENLPTKTTKGRKRRSRNTAPDTGKPIRKVASQRKLIRRVGADALEQPESEDSTARIQSSLQSVIPLLDSRGTSPRDRESIQTLAEVARSALGRHSGVLHSEELSITRKCFKSSFNVLGVFGSLMQSSENSHPFGSSIVLRS